ncbi:MAG TPA: biotin/lipoyl-containing protein [Vicinamibacteria bacterium]
MSHGSRLRKLRSLPEGKLHVVAVERIDDGYRVATDRSGAGTSLVRGPGVPVFSVLTESGLSFEVTVERRETEIEVALGQRLFRFESGGESKGISHRGKSSGRLEVKSPMPGKVVKVLVSKGDSVAAGQAILLFEAMKMQNELRSPQDGTVAEIAVEAGQAVEARERLYVLDPP